MGTRYFSCFDDILIKASPVQVIDLLGQSNSRHGDKVSRLLIGLFVRQQWLEKGNGLANQKSTNVALKVSALAKGYSMKLTP